MKGLRLAKQTKRSLGWAALFGALAAANIAQPFLGAGHVLTSSLVAAGFIVVALAALYRPSGFLTVSWRQLRSPRKLGTQTCAALVGVALIVVGTAIQLIGAGVLWLKI